MSEDAQLFAIGEPGRAAAELRRGLPTRFPDSADHELSEFEVPGAQVRAASIRGLMHRYRNLPRQDRFSIVYDEESARLLATVCDGVGQFDLSHEAAAFAAVATPKAFIKNGTWKEAIDEVNEQLTQFVVEASNRSRLDPVGEARMATTLAAVAIARGGDQWEASVAWTDDTSVWHLDEAGWLEISQMAEKYDNDGDLHSDGVRALPSASPGLAVRNCRVAGGAIFVLSDGVGDPLKSSQQVRETLAQWWATPPDIFTFARQVGFARKTHVDDRTAVGIWLN